MPATWKEVQIVDGTGKPVNSHRKISEGEEFANMPMDKESLQGMLDVIQDGRVSGMGIQEIGFSHKDNIVSIEIILSRTDAPNMELFKKGMLVLDEYMNDERITLFQIHARGPHSLHGQMLAEDVPACGFRTYGLAPEKPGANRSTKQNVAKKGVIQHEFFKIEVEGFDSDAYELGPAPILFPDVEKQVLFRLRHPQKPNPPAGDRRLTIRVTAPAYPGEVATVSQVIQIAPHIKHSLSLEFT